MMKTIFRKTAAGALIAILSATLIPIPPIQAQTSENSQRPTKEEIKTKINDKFCATIENGNGKFSENWAQREAKLKQKKEEKKNKWTERMAKNDARILELRAKADATMEKTLNDLLAKEGITDAQKKAIETYRSTRKTALAAKRSVTDAARDTFQAGVQSAVNTRQAGMDAITAAFKTSVSAAFGKAKTDCAAGVDAGTVRETLRASLRTAREKMQADKEANTKLKVSLEPLIAARKAKFEEARTAYKAVMEPALAALKAAFPDGSITITINL